MEAIGHAGTCLGILAKGWNRSCRRAKEHQQVA